MVTGIRLVISMCIHMAVEDVCLNECFPTFITAVTEFSPACSLGVTQSRFTWELPGTVATNTAFFMSDFHVLSWKLSGNFRGHFSHRITLLLVPTGETEGDLMFALCLSVILLVCHTSFPVFSWLCFHICMKLPPYDELHINFDFRHGWLTFSWVIAFCSKFAFRTFLGYAFTYLNETWLQDFIWRVTVQAWLLSRLTYFLMIKLFYLCWQYFRISEWKSVARFHMNSNISSLTSVTVYLLFMSHCPLFKIPFPDYSCMAMLFQKSPLLETQSFSWWIQRLKAFS